MWSINLLNRAVCSEESRVMFMRQSILLCFQLKHPNEAIKKEKPNKVLCDSDEIDIYSREASPLVLPIRCK